MTKKIVCFGDSNTWGYNPQAGTRYPESVRWTGKLAEISGYEIVEEGLNGRTSCFPDPTTPWANGSDYIEACVLSHAPFDALVIMLGTNDMKTFVCNNAHASAMGVMQVAEKARNAMKSPDTKTLIVCPVPFGDHATKIPGTMLQLNEDSIANSKRLHDYLEEMAKTQGFGYLNAASVAETSAEDAVHLSPSGHEALAEAVFAKLKALLD